MSPERELHRLLAGLDPERRPGEYVFVVLPEEHGLHVEAIVREDEGLTGVVRRADADAADLPYDFIAAWLALRVHSALDAVGLTAAVSAVLAEAGISCNVLAGFHHDHLLVPVERADEALEALRALAGNRTAAEDVQEA